MDTFIYVIEGQKGLVAFLDMEDQEIRVGIANANNPEFFHAVKHFSSGKMAKRWAEKLLKQELEELPEATETEITSVNEADTAPEIAPADLVVSVEVSPVTQVKELGRATQ